jgi:hypothetical protein
MSPDERMFGKNLYYISILGNTPLNLSACLRSHANVCTNIQNARIVVAHEGEQLDFIGFESLSPFLGGNRHLRLSPVSCAGSL